MLLQFFRRAALKLALYRPDLLFLAQPRQRHLTIAITAWERQPRPIAAPRLARSIG